MFGVVVVSVALLSLIGLLQIPHEYLDVRRLSSSEERWSFSWPLYDDGSCRCQSVSWGEYADESSCLQAFADYPHEACTYHGHGVVPEDCKFAVAVAPGLNNNDCLTLCEKASSQGEWQSFKESCTLAKYKVNGVGAVIVENTHCFSNQIYGHSDRSIGAISSSVVAFKIVRNVKTAVMCQSECQRHDGCVYWFWRATPDDRRRAPVFALSDGLKLDPAMSDIDNSLIDFAESMSQSVTPDDGEPLTCYLKDASTIASAKSAVIPVGALASGTYPPLSDDVWANCDLRELWAAVKATHKRAVVGEQCDCGCVWTSLKHVGGPKNCSPGNASFTAV
eukprot:CAMPEP_0113844780 /NCGR_PEP_ID=MMETSP0372-20130328/412_1 /TAXON_ID=340204 /ORGANISM="Lankesteria abbotti" /LENGTH=334 /DNA_ID=CAMNT_0000813791 /DNA_START=40 /DNA_END=1044 /DNA_ORIENTATION=+ /assembly_acc=CAM_ASM_000359